MKQTNSEITSTKRQYEQPRMEVVKLNNQAPLLVASQTNGNVNPGQIGKKDF